MKQLHILLFFISITTSLSVCSQNSTDTIPSGKSYALRVGIDISKPIISIFEDQRKGLEITGDFHFLKNYYAAVELGYEDATFDEDQLNFSTDGSYIKIGANYNAYQNWIGMNNEIFFGARYAFSLFKQTLNSYTPHTKNTYFIAEPIEPNTKFKDLSAHWLEFVAGLKVETFKNLYLGAQVSVKKMIKTKEPENFKNLYVPGFNRVFSNDMGIGFNYTLSYLIPILKKKK